MMFDHNGSPGAEEEEELALSRGKRVAVFVAVWVVVLVAIRLLAGCAAVAPSGEKLLRGNADILRCQELGRATYHSDAGAVAAYDVYFVCTQEAGLQ